MDRGKKRPLRAGATYLDKAIREGHAYLLGEGKTQKIHYVATQHRERYSDPEERVRAEFWAELIFRYGYAPLCIGIEITVPDRTPRDAADLVIFHDEGRTRPYAVIECKAEGINDHAFAQAVEQAAGNGTWAKLRATYVGVVAGTLAGTRRFLDFSDKYGVLEREKNIVADLPRQYGKPEEWRFRKGAQDDIVPITREALIRVIRKCHQTLWDGGKLSPPAAFGEFCKLLFVKITDELHPRRPGEPYSFQIKTHEPSDRLAHRIHLLYAEAQAKDPALFTEPIRIDHSTLRTLVSHMESISFNATDLDTKGVAFERFMDGFFKGDFGQYFTPREIIAFAVSVMPPEQDDLVIDPACGSGGFLLYALDHIRREAAEYYDHGSAAWARHWRDFATKQLFGIEINDEIARVAKMNMILHDDGHGNIACANALPGFDELQRRTGNNKLKAGGFDLVLTNPPFGAGVDPPVAILKAL